MAGEIALLIGRDGLVRPLVVGKGPKASQRAAEFLATIAPEIAAFHEAVVAKLQDTPAPCSRRLAREPRPVS
jgi:hypothetical protein